MLLLSDGTVMAQNGGTTSWYRLSPDSSGSYANGAWSTRAPMSYSRLSYSSAVLQDGRVFVAGGEFGNGTTNAEVYTPATDSWAVIPVPPGLIDPNNTLDPADGHNTAGFSASGCKTLPNGSVLLLPVHPYIPGRTVIFDPASNSLALGHSLYRGINQDKASLVKLPDDSLLTIDPASTLSERYLPSSGAWVADAVVPVSLYDTYGSEIGPAFLLPNGKAIFFGATGHTAIYTPSGNSNPGSWVAGPDFPNGQGVPDAPGAMMVNGKILCVVSPVPYAPTSVFTTNVSFYEYDYLAGPVGAFTQLASPVGGFTLNGPTYPARMLALPNGSVLFTTGGSQLYTYTPSGSPLDAGKPTITGISSNPDGSFHLTGTLLNGISEGANYGDDAQMDSNYPLVRARGNGSVIYLTTYNWNRTGVMTGGTRLSTEFSATNSLLTPGVLYSLEVVANGIASAPIPFPSPIWVDPNNLSIIRFGTYAFPYKFLSDGINAAGAGGGLVYIRAGRTVENLTIATTNLLDIHTLGGAAIIDGSASNIVFTIRSGNVSLTGLTITNGAGGIFNSNATLTLNNCIISGHRSAVAGTGHGLYNDVSGVVVMNNCTVAGNNLTSASADAAGAGVSNAGAVRMTNCTISGNTVLVGSVAGSARGAGIGNFGALTMVACTVAGNLCTNSAGGPCEGGGVYNSVGTLTIGNSIIASNGIASPMGGIVRGPDCDGTFTSLGFNLVGTINDSTGWIGFTDLLGSTNAPLDAELGPLQDNGGGIPTHALLPCSPAIDSGQSFGVASDQRGSPRPAIGSRTNAIGGDGSDIGAFEVSGSVFTTLNITVIGPGRVARNPDQCAFSYGAGVTLTATPDCGASFAGWSGDLTTIQNPLTVAATNLSLRANFTQLPCACLPSGLVSWWRAEGDASDVQANYSGTLTTGVSFAPGKVGQAFNFDGVSGHQVSLNPSTLAPPWTVECWVNRQDSPDASAQLLSDGSTALKLEQYPNTRQVGFSRYTVADYVFNYTAPLATWVHLAFVGNPASTQLYVNGALQDTVPYAINLGMGQIGSACKGLVDELSVYNRALSPAEIQNVYTAAAGKCLPVCTQAPSGLITWWPGAGNANDLIGANNGTPQNGATFAPGEVGTAFSFDGMNDYVLVPDSRSLDVSSGLTIEAWVKTSGTADYSRIVDKYYDPAMGGNNTGYGVGFHTGGTMRCDIGNGSGSYAVAFNSTVVTDGRWHHVAAVFTPLQATLYVDGIAGTVVALAGFAPNTTQPLYLGEDPATSDRFYTGLLDEVSLYNRALSAAEIQTIYNAGSAGKCVAVLPPSPPVIGSITLRGGKLVISGTNGAARNNYLVLVSTNVALPRSNWTRLMTNVFDASGNFSFTNAIDPATPQLFYQLQLP
jgi:hypothetical protein